MAPFRIDASDGTSESGGGNQGIIFFSTLSVTPSEGAAGTTVTIDNTGAGFFGTMIVKFGGAGGTAADNITVASQQQLTCDVPAGVSGTVAIYVENPDGESGTIAGFVVQSANTTTRKTAYRKKAYKRAYR